MNEQGEITFHGRTAESLLNEFGSPLYVIDTDDVRARAAKFVKSAANAFNNTVTHVSFAGKHCFPRKSAVSSPNPAC